MIANNKGDQALMQSTIDNKKRKEYIHSRALEGFKPEPWSTSATFIHGNRYALDKFQREAVRRRFNINPPDVIECIQEETIHKIVGDYEGKLLVGWTVELGRSPRFSFRINGSKRRSFEEFQIDARELVIRAIEIKVHAATVQKRRTQKLLEKHRRKQGLNARRNEEVKVPSKSRVISDEILGI